MSMRMDGSKAKDLHQDFHSSWTWEGFEQLILVLTSLFKNFLPPHIGTEEHLQQLRMRLRWASFDRLSCFTATDAVQLLQAIAS